MGALVVWAAGGPPRDPAKPHLSLAEGAVPDRALPQTASSRMGNPLRRWSKDGRVKAREGGVGDRGVKSEGLALGVSVPPLPRALPETPECPGYPAEVSRPEVQWVVQWGHPVRSQGLP